MKTVLKTLPVICLMGLLFSPAANAAGNSGMGWGYGFYGQLGNGAPVTALPCQCLKVPTAMAGLSSATQISASQNHTLALLADGTVRAWGFNLNGQLGDGGTTDSATGTSVSGLSNVTAVAAGNSHSLALLSNGTVVTWGRNVAGQLGGGTSSGPESCGGTPCSKVPVSVPGLSDVVAIGAGRDYSVALLSSGTAVAWGFDQFGELGDGVGVPSGCKCIDHPVPVPGLSGAMSISVGPYEASALLGDGTVKDWGRNVSGGLGNGTVTTATPCECLGPVSVSGLAGVKAIAAGGLHGMALLSNGVVQAWGANEKGQLGNGAASTTGCKCIPSPAAVGGLSNAQGIAAGINHSLALLSDGSARSWGENESGELGDGSTIDRAAPVSVNGLSGATEISAGEINSYALVGPSQALNVSLAGAGSGAVGGPAGILCGASCSNRYPQGQVEILRAEPAAGNAFAGFSGACTGTGTCQLRMDQDQNVTATFGPPKGTTITAATITSRKKKATFSFTAPGAITGFECELIRPKPVRHKKGKSKGKKAKASKRHRAPKASFSGCASPKAYKNLRPGAYTFKVRALDILGADETPATKKFKIKKPKVKKHKSRR